MHLERLPVCFVCGKERSTAVCGDCKRQHYCSLQCLERDRVRHKAVCGHDGLTKVVDDKIVPAEFKTFVAEHGAGGDTFCAAVV